LKLGLELSGNYIDLLDAESYITGNTVRNSRWRINDNLLGVPAFCPMVRRSPAVEEMLATNLKGQIDELKDEYSPEIFNRATQYRASTFRHCILWNIYAAAVVYGQQ